MGFTKFCLVLFVPLENFSLIRGRNHYRWRAAIFNLCSTHMVILQRGFFSVPHFNGTGHSKHDLDKLSVITTPLWNGQQTAWMSWVPRYNIKTDAPCHYLCDTLKNSNSSLVMNVDHIYIIWSHSAAILTTPCKVGQKPNHLTKYRKISAQIEPCL